jgi:hypothetical protein
MEKNQTISEDFAERKMKFEEELDKLLEKYSLKLWVALEPYNFLAKLLKKFIKITWRMILIDQKQPQK